ncbi:transient receptor potential cation channel subfamily M member 1-like [Corticium candelabrum]|uniref:transient receptor potential cation channel subfamily M member 1-like n=1 Tax=Corticium candelabrum TaxID=121492 RepID=UPI002E2560A1|nr:transient receptor potential cation channel subfamily M member 1-like [Corticium candelabrum]
MEMAVQDENEKFTKEHIDTISSQFFGRFFGKPVKKSVFPVANDCHDMFRSLFIWALLTERWKLAKVFWAYGPEPLAAALSAGVLFKAMADRLAGDAFREGKRKTLEDQQMNWNRRACKLLQECYQTNRAATEMLLKCTSEKWGDQNSISLANANRNKEFTGDIAVQRVLSKAWMGSLISRTPSIKIFLSAIFPFLIALFIKVEAQTDFTCTPAKSKTEVDNRETAARRSLSRNVSQTNFMSGTAPPKSQSVAKKFQKLREKLSVFYTSPVSKYCLSLASYLVFLCIFCFNLLVRWDSMSPTALEILTAVWVMSLVAEDLFQIHGTIGLTWYDKLCLWLSDILSKLKVVALLLYLAAVALRYSPHDGDKFYPNTIRWARILFSIDICFFFMRVLEFFYVNEELGPKLYMIYRMIRDVIVFITILLVWIVSYGVAIQALIFPFQDASWDLLYNVFYIPFWQIHGQFYFDHMNGESVENCGSIDHVNETTTGDYTMCPQKEWVASILLAVYVTVTVIILLNLLIAIFNDTYRSIQKEARLLWKFERYKAVVSYINKSSVPHPLVWLAFVYHMLRGDGPRMRESDICIPRDKLSFSDVDSMISLEAKCLEKVLKFHTETED